jgi:hypothetical protein
MNIRKSILLSAVALAFAAPGFSSATSLWYPEKGDSGGEFRADHFQSTKARTEILKEVQVAHQDAESRHVNARNEPTMELAKSKGLDKTRSEVQGEPASMSTEDQQRAKELYRGN